MKKRSARFDAILSILLLLGLAVLFYTMRYGPLPLTQQIRNLKAAELHVPALQALLTQDARYAGLKAAEGARPAAHRLWSRLRLKAGS